MLGRVSEADCVTVGKAKTCIQSALLPLLRPKLPPMQPRGAGLWCRWEAGPQEQARGQFVAGPRWAEPLHVSSAAVELRDGSGPAARILQELNTDSIATTGFRPAEDSLRTFCFPEKAHVGGAM